jgi:hypothetical protein
MGFASTIPVLEGGPAKRGEPCNWFPGGRGDRGNTLSQSPREGILDKAGEPGKRPPSPGGARKGAKDRKEG